MVASSSRHACVLAQPDGSEGFGAIRVDVSASNLAVLEVVDAGDPRGGLDAVSASGCDDEEGQNAALHGCEAATSKYASTTRR